MKDLPSSAEATSAFNSKCIEDSDYIDIDTSSVKSPFGAEANVFADLSWSMAWIFVLGLSEVRVGGCHANAYAACSAICCVPL